MLFSQSKKVLKNWLGPYWVFRAKELSRSLFGQKKEDPAFDLELYKSFIQKGDLCFDVGANIGNKVDMLLALGAEIVAIEPQPESYKILKHKYGNKVHLVRKGLGQEEEVKDFYISDGITISSFSKEWIHSVQKTRFKNYNWNKIVKTEMTTLDKLIQQYGLPVFIKIDVEGYELEVLKGLSSPKKMISFEYTIPERTDQLHQCLNQIEKINGNILCNYTKGESMKLILKKWMTLEEFRSYISDDKVLGDNFGDIYIQSLPGSAT